MYDNPWIYNDEPIEEFPKGIAGFVYLITDTATGKMYIGRKYVSSTRKVKGKARRQTSESDWKSYYSSNDWIKQQAKLAPKRFTRVILRMCKTKGETNWFEIEEQVKRDVLKSDDYLNDQILGKYFKKNVSRY